MYLLAVYLAFADIKIVNQTKFSIVDLWAKVALLRQDLDD